jgi:hypothetical protein
VTETTDDTDNDKEQPPWLRSKYEVPEEQITIDDNDPLKVAVHRHRYACSNCLNMDGVDVL